MPLPLWLCVGVGNRKRRKKREPAARQLPGRLERTITPCRPSALESNRASAHAPSPAPAPAQPLRPCPARPRRGPPPPCPLPPLPPLHPPPQPAHGNQPRQRRPRPLEEDGYDDDDDDDDDRDDESNPAAEQCQQEQADVEPVAAVSAFESRAPIPVPPRPVLPRRSPNRESPSPQRAAPVIRVPPRPVLARVRQARAPASSAPGRIAVPPRPRLPMHRGTGQIHAKRGAADASGGERRDDEPRAASTREEEQKRSAPEEEEVRRKEVQRELKGKAKLTDRESEEAATEAQRQERPHIEAVQHGLPDPLALTGPQLPGSDPFHADLARQKQIEASLEELRQLRESERWKAIERQRAQDKPARMANVEALGMRQPKGGATPLRSSSKPATRHTRDKASDLQGGAREAPWHGGVFLVRALDRFKGNMRESKAQAAPLQAPRRHPGHLSEHGGWPLLRYADQDREERVVPLLLRCAPRLGGGPAPPRGFQPGLSK